MKYEIEADYLEELSKESSLENLDRNLSNKIEKKMARVFYEILGQNLVYDPSSESQVETKTLTSEQGFVLYEGVSYPSGTCFVFYKGEVLGALFSDTRTTGIKKNGLGCITGLILDFQWWGIPKERSEYLRELFNCY